MDQLKLALGDKFRFEMQIASIKTSDCLGNTGVPLLLLSFDCLSTLADQLSKVVDYILELNHGPFHNFQYMTLKLGQRLSKCEENCFSKYLDLETNSSFKFE